MKKNHSITKMACLSLILSLGLALNQTLFAKEHKREKYLISSILVMNIDSTINPATANYLQTGFQKAQNEGHQLILIKLNTPGGLVTTTKDILTQIGKAPIPVAIWITPEGASATSAGAIIASGAHFLFMQNGTNMGAATPVTMKEDMGKDLRSKAINDLTALTSSLAKARGRNGEPFKKMIEEAASYGADEALEKKMINSLAHNLNDILSFLKTAQTTIQGKKYQVSMPHRPKVSDFDMDLGQKILNIFAHPSVAYILFLLGAALLYFELQAPGGFIAGAIGAICLLLAGIGLQVLPLNWGAMGLIVLAFILFLVETFITSFGIISIAGLVSLTIGSLFLFRTDNAYLAIDERIVFSASLAIGCFLIFLFFFLVKGDRGQKKENFFQVVGEEGHIVSINQEDKDTIIYQVKVSGRIWKAKSHQKLDLDDHIKVTQQDNTHLILTVDKIS